MDYLDILRNDAKLAEDFDTLFDFRLLDALEERDTAEGRCTFSLPGMAFAVDGAGGEYHLLEDGSIGYWSSEGTAGRLAESMDDLFHLIVFSICWHDYCDSSKYADAATLEEYGQNNAVGYYLLFADGTLGTHCESFTYAHRHETFHLFYRNSMMRRIVNRYIPAISMKMMEALQNRKIYFSNG